MNQIDKKNIEEIIEEAYIKGLHREQDKDLMLSGFHREFTMFVLKDGILEKISIDLWLKLVKDSKEQNSALWLKDTSFRNLKIDVVKNTASIKLDVFKGKDHFSTDFMMLYKFPIGWRIVSKLYQIPL